VEQYVIKGGNALKGEVNIAGAKNAALGILAASILTDETVIIENLPDVSDINVFIQAMQSIGVQISHLDRNTIKVNAIGIDSTEVEEGYMKKIRASYYMLGALTGKYHEATVVLPGGCKIGTRPIDQHIKGFTALGAKVKIENGCVKVRADRLIANEIYLDVVTVGATINIMLAAVLAEGKTTIENAAKEPHVVDIANFLNSMGANIKGAGTDTIRISGVEKLHGTTYSVIPDQIEAGTFMFASAVTGGDVLIKNVIPKHLESISAKLIEMGCDVIEYDDAVRVKSSGKLSKTNIKTLPYPGFPTDMQPQGAVALGLAEGTSIVTESIFENRFKYVDELARMGATIKVEGNTAIIEGVEKYSGAAISAPDLRAGAALVIAALAAEGFSTIEDIHYIERGYEDFPRKLSELGALIEKVNEEKEVRKFKLRVG